MAVYTKISNNQLDKLLENYNIGKAISLKEIEQGVENSNYFLKTEKDLYILTIYEKRINEDDLPFYLNLMQHLAAKSIPCPVPIQTKDGQNLSNIDGKPCAIVSFLKGKSTRNIGNIHLSELGKNLAKMHLASNSFNMERENNLSIDSWGDLFDKIKDRADEVSLGLADEIEGHINHLCNNWPTSLYSGIIHADLFPDNVFFDNNNRLVGIIDYYFACNDFLMYDLAICINAWCFENNREFNITKARKLLSSYNKVRKISEQELDALPLLASGAAMRFLLTRTYDWLNQTEGALVKPKDPMEYLNKLRFHNGIKSHREYGL